MPKPLIDAVLALIESVFPEVGSQEFYFVFGSCVATWVIVARVFMGLLKSGKGFIAAAMGLVVPLMVGLTAYGLSVWHLVPRVEQEWAEVFLPFGVFGLVLIITVFVTARRIFALNGYVSIFVFAFASAASVGAYFCAEITLEMLDKGSKQIQQREERSEKTINSLL